MKFNDFRTAIQNNIVNTNNTINTNQFISPNNFSGTATTLSFISLSSECIEVNQYNDYVEFIYIETDHTPRMNFYSSTPNKKVYKIIASVVDGKFTYGEKIYGEIVPPQEEYYNFD